MQQPELGPQQSHDQEVLDEPFLKESIGHPAQVVLIVVSGA